MNGTPDLTGQWLNFAQQPVEQGGLGLKPHQAAGLVGNLQNESGQSLSPWGVTGDNGTAWGTAQWRGDRLNALKSQFPDSYQTPQAQMQFMRSEMLGPENRAYKALLASSSPEEAANAVNHLYERSADTTGHREAAARALMQQFGGGAPDTGGALSFASTSQPTSKSSMPTPALSADAQGQGALAAPTEDRNDRFYQGMMGAAAALAGISNPSQANSLAALGASMHKQGGSWTTQVMKNGQILMSNTNGQTRIVGKPGDYSGDDAFSPIMGKDSAGNPTILGTFNKNTAEYKPIDTGQQQQQPVQPTTMEDLQAINPLRAKAAGAVLRGEVDLPKGSRLNPAQNQLRNDVLSIGGVDETKLAGRRTTQQEMSRSAPSSLGGQLDSSGASVKHVEDLIDDYSALHNSDGYLGTAGNFLANHLTSPGSARDATLANLKNHAKNASDEITKMMTNGHGTEGDRASRLETLFQPSAAPQTTAAAIKGMLDDMVNKRKETTDRVHQTMGDEYMKSNPRFTDFDAHLERVYKKLDLLSQGKPTTDTPAAGLKSAEPAKAASPGGKTSSGISWSIQP